MLRMHSFTRPQQRGAPQAACSRRFVVCRASRASGARLSRSRDPPAAAAAPGAATTPAPAAATPGGVEVAAPAVDCAELQQEQPEQPAATPFNWHKQWWPVAIVDQLDASVPNRAQLLGMDLVLWRDKAGEWRAFRDCCPHRLAPLSEGRIDSKTGNLYCNYHGWQFDSSGACAAIPQLPQDAKPPNPQRSCVQAFPTQVAEELLWVWADSGPTAAADAAATPAAMLAPEIAQFGRDAFWSSKLFLPSNSALGFWYQRYCNASFRAVKENVFNDPSHDTVLHHGQGGLDREMAKPGVVQEFTFDASKGYKIKRLNLATGRVVSDTCVFPAAIRRDFAGDPRFGGGIGYVTPTSKGKCNMMIGIVRHPEFAPQPQVWWQRLLAPLSPATPEWLNHITLHNVVDADVAMQHGVDINNSRGLGSGYMPAIGMDQGPIAFKRWLQRFGGGGPPTDNEEDWAKGGPETPLPRRELLDRYHSHTKHCRYCSTALKNFQTLNRAATMLAQLLAAASLAVAAVGLVQAAGVGAGAAAASTGFGPAVVLLAAATGAAAGVAAWAHGFIQRFIFVDYDKTNVSKM